MNNYLTPREYLPHEPPMVLIDEVIYVDDNKAVTRCYVNRNGVLSPFLNENGDLPAFFALEIFAQSVGVWNVVDESTIRASSLIKLHYQIVVDVDFSRFTKYEIKYIKSENLQDNGKGEIHKLYFKMVGSLKKAIDKSLKEMSRRERYCGKDAVNNLNSLCVLND